MLTINKKKNLFFVCFLFLIYFLSPKKVFSQVVINEFCANPTTDADWVELFNTLDQEINITGWILDDEGTSSNMVEIKEATISARGFLVFDVGSRLNKSEDTIYLIDSNNLTVDEYSYSKDFGDNISLGRMPDGDDWGICESPTKGGKNNCVLPTPIPSNTPTPDPTDIPQPTDTPTPTQTPTPTLSPTATPTLKPTLVPTMFKTELDGSGSANFEQVLGTQNSDSQGYDISLEGSTGSAEGLQTNKKKINFWPFLFIIPGAGMIAFSLLILAKQKKDTV